jgi:hypothetical protein
MPATFRQHAKDVALHIAGGGLVTSIALLLPHPLDVIFCVTALGWFRELAQAVKSNVIAAIRSMPGWGAWGHAEWLAWGVGATLIVVL